MLTHRAGIPWITVRRAADRIGVLKRKGGMKDGWYWRLPTSEDAQTSTEDGQDAHSTKVNTFEHLRDEVSTLGAADDPGEDF